MDGEIARALERIQAMPDPMVARTLALITAGRDALYRGTDPATVVPTIIDAERDLARMGRDRTGD